MDAHINTHRNKLEYLKMGYFVMSTIGERIKQERDALGWNQLDLAMRCGWSNQGRIGHYETGRREPKRADAEKIASALGVRIEWLWAGIAPKHESNARESSLKFQEWDEESEMGDEFVFLPSLSIEASAGSGTNVLNEHIERQIPFMRHSLRSYGVTPHDAKLIRVHGPSMEPVLKSGTLIGVNIAKAYPIEDGKIYAFRDVDMIRVKMLERIPGGGIRLKSFNSEYTDEDIPAEEVPHRITIIGKIFWSSTMWD